MDESEDGPKMNSGPERWTRDERRQALKAFFESEEARRFLDVFSLDCTAEEDRAVFLRDAERRFRSDDEETTRWWNGLRALVKNAPDRDLALAEPLAQHGVAIEELYECLPEDFDHLALIDAIRTVRNIQSGGGRGLQHGVTIVDGWTDEQIRSRLEEVKAQLNWAGADSETRQRWESFESENTSRLTVVLRVAEELANRKATVKDFFTATDHANTANIRAVLHYLDYMRLKQAGESNDGRTRERDQESGSGLTTGGSRWWLKPAPGMTIVRGWADEQVRRRIEEVKTKLDLDGAPSQARQWWESFDMENEERPVLALRLAEELANRKSTIADYYGVFAFSGAKDIQANLAYLDYSRLAKEETEYETVLLDDKGDTMERRRGRARQFIEELVPGVALEMVEIPGGTFVMGSPENEANSHKDEKPQHEVSVPSFHIGKFAITQEQWNVVAQWEKVDNELNPDPSHFKGNDRPVENISWLDAKEFCARLAKRTGRGYRLPTEAEWEYACRAGTTTPFAFGETIAPEVVNYDGNYPYANAKKGTKRGETTPVGSLGIANSFGLFDMHGNVWEWCEDVRHENYQDAPTDGSAWLSDGDSSKHMLRGGSFILNGDFCRSAYRHFSAPDFRNLNVVGFRLAVSARTL